MAKQTDLDCSGCKISMFCSRKDKQEGQPCETDLRAVFVAFVIPLVCIVLVLVLAQGRLNEGWTALAILVVLAVYFLAIRLLKPDFTRKKK
ncbi:MAG: SoxR reducing system RseC family protein [Bacteroidaceae bacterium]|nr:SoxR reducing system RseC family protein [Bacteroidaceae bacterium]